MRNFFAFALVAGMLTTVSASAQEFGGLTAKFVLTGKAPAPAKLDVNKDPQFCGKHKLVDETIVVGKDGELANVVVFLSPATGQKVPTNPAKTKELAPQVTLDNENCRFSPHIVVMTTEQQLVIGNKDPVGHNSKADLFANSPFNDLIPSGGTVKKKIDKAEKVPAGVSCNIHPWMRAYLVVRDNPYVGVTDDTGTLKIDGIPAGEWSFIVWHETGYVKGQQKGKDLGWKKGKVTVKIAAGKDTDLGTIEVPAASLAK
jgi:hypothetical protein